MTPTATYRLQLQPDFPFSAAEKAVPYLAALGVSHLHLSPVLEAVPGSTHGYDVVDHSRGTGRAGRRGGAAAAGRHGPGSTASAWSSTSCPTTWPRRPGTTRPSGRCCARAGTRRTPAGSTSTGTPGDGKMLLPVLPGPIGDELAVAARRGRSAAPRRPAVPAGGRAPERLPLPELLDAQHYRLAWWRLARTELNYRRFFTISELIGLRVEDPEVFAATHAKILELVRDGVVEGLRIDHPDGLADPERVSAPAERGDRRGLLDGRGEDPHRRRVAPGRLAGRRHHRLRRAAPHRRGVHRPGGCRGAERRYRESRGPPGTAGATGRGRCAGPPTR